MRALALVALLAWAPVTRAEGAQDPVSRSLSLSAVGVYLGTRVAMLAADGVLSYHLASDGRAERAWALLDLASPTPRPTAP